MHFCEARDTRLSFLERTRADYPAQRTSAWKGLETAFWRSCLAMGVHRVRALRASPRWVVSGTARVYIRSGKLSGDTRVLSLR